MEQVAEAKKVTASGIAFSADCVLKNLLIGMDKLNDPEITVYEGTDNSGDEKVPTNTYDASALGLNGAVNLNVRCHGGIYVEISCSGTVEVSVHFVPAGH